MLESRVKYIEKEEECYKDEQIMQKRRRMLQTRVGYQKKKKNATNMLGGRVYRKRKRMLQTCWVGYIENEEECYKHVGLLDTEKNRQIDDRYLQTDR